MFNPNDYAKNIQALNIEKQAKIDERLNKANEEAVFLAKKMMKNDSSIKAIYLFGSVATGIVNNLDFDIDLAMDGGDEYKAMDIAEISAFKIDIINLDLLSSDKKKLILAHAKRLV